jgi:hypothetical protein
LSTYEDRLAALERKVATMQLERIYEQKKMKETTPSDQSFKEINYNLTMLLGIASGQEQAIGEVKTGLHSLEESVNDRFHSLENGLHSLEESVNDRFQAQDAKLDQILLLLNKRTSNPDQET